MHDQLTLISSAELGDSPSPQKQLDGERLSSAKKRHTAKEYLESIGPKSQSSQMSGSSMEHCTGELPFSAEDSRASASAVAGSKEARKMTVTSGQKCCGLLKRQDPVSSWQRMLLESSTWHSTRCFLTWKAKGTPQGRLYFQLAVSMPSTSDQGYGLLGSGEETQSAGKIGSVSPVDCLSSSVANVTKENGSAEIVENGHTPITSTSKTGVTTAGHPMFPTPTANEDAAGTCQGKMQLMLANHPGVRMSGTGTLNPLWVEWLMGYQIKHTESPRLATQSSPR